MLLRRIGFLLCGLAVMLGSCGRQITPDTALGPGGSGLVPGTMQVTFRTQAALDYANVGYMIVFNTRGAGTSPYAGFLSANPQDFSYAFVLGNINNTMLGSAFSTQTIQLWQYYQPAGGKYNAQQIMSILPSQLQAVIPGNGQANQFTITFQRSLLNQPPPNGQCSSATAAPTTAASPAPTPTPCGQTAPTWYVNFFTIASDGSALDALGLGKQDQTVAIALPVTTPIDDTTQLQPYAGFDVYPPSAKITGGEIVNAP